MRAVVIHAARDLRIDTLPDAPTPGPGEVAVRIRAGGICGSDLHYYQHGGFGTIRVREPMALGHEIAGEVSALGDGVSRLAIGTRVAVNPSRPCNACRYCLSGQRNHCLDMRFLGSAMRFPHVQGGFRETLICEAERAVPVPEHVSLGEAAMAEPLAVCLHAGMQAGPLLGRRVMVTGAGPIGLLCLLVARLGGAAETVVTDVAERSLEMARRLGATTTVNVARDAAALQPYAADKGRIDVLFECSGNQAALVGALDQLRPGATIVQVGLGGEVTLPMNVVVAKELNLRGTFRFDREFALAVELMASRQIDVTPLITATLPLDAARDAFELAGDRSRAMKVQIGF